MRCTARRIAIVGAGITGSVVASYLSEHYYQQQQCQQDDGDDDNKNGNGKKYPAKNSNSNNTVEIHIFDQGRRGPGGRSSHRTVQLQQASSTASATLSEGSHDHDNNPSTETATEAIILDDDEYDDNGDNSAASTTTTTPLLHFDHGCQFFRADSVSMKRHLVSKWLQKGWVEPWNARFGSFPLTSSGTTAAVDFFGVPPKAGENNDMYNGIDETVYVGVGGMNQLPRKIVQDCCSSFSASNGHGVVVTFHKGTRVRKIKRNPTNETWDLDSVRGGAAYHDTKTHTATGFGEENTASHSNFDMIVFTDISSAFQSWHKASAGIPDDFRRMVPRRRPRIPLFSCMVAFDEPIGNEIPFDAFTVSKSILWFAARSNSKPGCPPNSPECWTLISTPSYAVQQIQETTMRDPTTGAFRPQENDYLNTVPGPALLDAFLSTIQSYLNNVPSVIYLQGQRWGSGLPAPEDVVASEVEEICGTTYVKHLHSSLVYSTKVDSHGQDMKDFVAYDEVGLYYAGDFCSNRNPGFEAAALSGLDVAKHIVEYRARFD
jgi:predicted NAD/FAD-dependent oxidoreductase